MFTILKENITIDLEDFEMELIDSGLEELLRKDIVTICNYLDFNNLQLKIANINIEKSELQRHLIQLKKFLSMMQKMF